MRKKLLIGVTAVALVGLALSGCSSRGADTGSTSAANPIKKGITVGVALPAKTSQNWVLAKASFEKALDAAGFKADVQYAAAGTNTVADQQNQIQSMVTKGDKVIIIAAQDGSQLSTQVAQAKAAGTTVIAWDRNILNTKDVDFYVAFNNYKVGQLQAQALVDGMKAKKPTGPYNIEIFAGSNTDANATVFYNGAMSVLQPLIDKGDLKVPSAQTSFQQVQTADWDPKNSQTRMTNIITKSYSSGTKLDGVLSPNDTLGRSILTACHAAGLPYPIVTGQDSETASIPLIMNGTQYSTIYKNTDEEAQGAVDLITDLAKGMKKPTGVDYNDKTNAGNGKITVPYKALTPILVTKENAVEAYANNPTLEALAKGGK